MNDAPLWLLFSILGGLLILSGYFSGTETAMMSLNRYRLKHLRKRSRGARRAYKMLKRPDRLIGGTGRRVRTLCGFRRRPRL